MTLTPTSRPARSRRIIVRLAILLLLVVGLVAGIGSLRTPTGPLDVPATGPVKSFERQVLRVATFNIHSGVGADGQENLQRTADAIRGFDLVALNEVGGAFTAGEDQASELGRLVGLAAIWAPTENRWFYPHFGNGLLHRPAIDGYQRIPLAGTAGRGKRNVIRTRIEWQGVPLEVLVTHIDRGADRAAQLKRVRQLFLSLPVPSLLMGDMNTQTTDPLIRPLREAPGVVDGLRQVLGSRDKPGRIDYIFTRGLSWKSAGSKEPEVTKASDHPVVWGEVELERKP